MAQTLQPGTPLQGGKYVIKQVLGQGGFGITYLARQVSLGRDVAIKEFFMQDNCLRDKDSATVSVPSTGSATQVEKYRKKFDKEARTLALLDHPHIVRVIEIFEENGTVYYVMQHLPGGSLKDLVKKRGPLPEDEALHWVGQIAEALQYMHQEHRICHYDVKPGNILLDRKGNAVLIDFGISKNYDKDGNETSTTPIGLSTGYAPIEQYQGISVFSPASDVYALGATLYCLVMGHPPVSSLTLAQGVPLEFDHPVSASTRNLIFRAMKVSTNERPQSVDLFLDKPKKNGKKSRVPQKLLDDETTRLPGDDTPPEALEPSTKKKGKSLAMILGALAALCIVGGAIWAFNRSSQPSTEAPIEVPADTVEVTQHKDTVELINAPTSRDEKLHPFFWKHGLAICAHFTAFGRGFAKKIDDMHNLYPQGFTLDDLNEVYGSKGQRWERIYQEFKPMENLGGSINDLKELVRPQEWKYAEPELLSLIEQYASTPFDASSLKSVVTPARPVERQSQDAAKSEVKKSNKANNSNQNKTQQSSEKSDNSKEDNKKKKNPYGLRAAPDSPLPTPDRQKGEPDFNL